MEVSALNILDVGLISEYVKNKGSAIKWQERKDNLFAPKNEDEGYFSALNKQLNETNKANSLKRIENKLRSGDRLSVTEKKYLRDNAPDLYEKAVKIEREREDYRKALERCKTKEEAHALHLSTMQMHISEALAISGNSSIPKEQKEEQMAFAGMKIAAANKEYAEYSSGYIYDSKGKRKPSGND